MKINEIYGPTIQGEGKTAGMKCIFVRMALCNLHCVWCDTPYTWNWTGTKFAHPDKYDKEKEVHNMDIPQIIDKVRELSLETTKTVVISGGEPMLQQDELLGLIRQLRGHGYRVEVETNGTIKPTDNFLEEVDQINCSPKLANNKADHLNNRIKPHALKKLASSEKTIFKFVVANTEDMEEIVNLVAEFDMKQVWLMAEGKTREEQLQRQDEVEKMAKDKGFHFTQRQHVLMYGNVRRV